MGQLVPIISTQPPALREVSLKVAAVNGINLGQGVCRMPVPEIVIEAGKRAISQGQNLYAPAQGVETLRAAIATKLRSFNKCEYSTDQIIVTAGSTGAFEAICHAFIKPGDEIVSFRPFYPYHHNALTRVGARVKYIDLNPPKWNFSRESLVENITQNTKFVLLNTPNNPTGKVFTRSELESIAEICLRNHVYCITDEVYEYMTYDGNEHISIGSIPEMLPLVLSMGSYSKTFAITGWRIGYVASPTNLFPAIRAASDQLYVCAPTPFQHAVAAGISELTSSYYGWLKSEYSRKREICTAGLRAAGLTPITPAGAYYIIANSSTVFPNRTADSVVDELIKKTHVGAVPASDFVGPEALDNPNIGNFFRFCFAVPDEVLTEACNKLKHINS